MIEGQTNIFDFLEEKKIYKYNSAFAGIGGMTMGLKELGFEGLVAWEYDPTSKRQYAAEAHKLLHPEIEVKGDICLVDTSEVPDMDLFCFTPPCQAFSVAGKRGGFEDTRGTLTFEALRIAKDKRPKILFMENVKGLINHDKGNTMGTIINAINDIGYIVDFTILNSKYFDVAQNRERVYLVAIREDLIEESPWLDIVGNTLLPKSKKKYQQDGAKTFNFEWPEQKEVKTKLKDFLDQHVEDKYYLSEEKTKNLVQQMDSVIIGSVLDTRQKSADTKDGKSAVRVSESICPTISATEQKDPKKIIEEFSDPKPIVSFNLNHYGNDQMNRVYSPYGLSPTLTVVSGGGREQKIYEEIYPCLTPFREEKRQNGPRFKKEGSEAHTITTIDRHGIAIGIKPKYRIRKLIPTECLRLQSVPEDKIKILRDNFSDSKLYKFAGNGLTTNVIKAIGIEIRKLLEGFDK